MLDLPVAGLPNVNQGQPTASNRWFSVPGNVSSFGESRSGELAVLSFNGRIYAFADISGDVILEDGFEARIGFR